MNKPTIATCILLSLLQYNLAHAFYGHIDDVVDDAKNHRMPRYIPEAMASLYRHLSHFSEDALLKSPSQKLALLRASFSLLSVTQKDAAALASEALAVAASDLGLDSSRAFKSGRNAAQNSELAHANMQLKAMVKSACESRCRPPKKEPSRKHEGRSEQARTKSLSEAKKTVLQAARIALEENEIADAAIVTYRVAEWLLLNEMVSNLAWQLPEIYLEEALWVPQDDFHATHPFGSYQSFALFHARFTRGLDKNHMIFITPVLSVIDCWTHLSLLQLGQFPLGSVFNGLPKDLLPMIQSRL